MITDVHMHYSPQTGPEFLTDFLSRTDTDSVVIQAVSHSRCLSLVPGALVMKHMSGDRFFVFGSPDLSAYYLHPHDLGEYLVSYAQLLLSSGCDGIKLLEGKPQMRKTHPIPDFDSPVWEPFWAYLEANEVPVLFHVNDPETNWSPDASDWVKQQGWWYDDSYINNEVQYAQVLRVLQAHPHLKVIFAHFFFMSAQLPRLDAILSSYPNVMVDLTPGIEMYENFSSDFASAKAFFDKYHDRICYGTDIGGRCILTNEGDPFNEKENLRRPEIVRQFLTMSGEALITSDGNFIHDRSPFTMKGLALPPDRLEEILDSNARRMIGALPRPTDPEQVLTLCALLRERMIDLASVKEDFLPDPSELDRAERYFSAVYYAD